MRRTRFTVRQNEILSLVAAGRCDKEIALELGVSYRTVRTHLERLFEEHGFHCRAEAVVSWLRATPQEASSQTVATSRRAATAMAPGSTRSGRSSGVWPPEPPSATPTEGKPAPA